MYQSCLHHHRPFHRSFVQLLLLCSPPLSLLPPPSRARLLRKPSLPVFLAGCKNILVLCGDTYLNRLWCVMELFVFLEMGASPERIELKMLAHTNSAAMRLRERFSTFDVKDATCFLQSDTDRLYGMLEAGFAGIDGFNTMVRQVLAKCLEEQSKQTAANLMQSAFLRKQEWKATTLQSLGSSGGSSGSPERRRSSSALTSARRNGINRPKTVEQEDFQKFKHYVTKAQAKLRGWRCQNEFSTMKTAADVVQFAIRKHQREKAAKARRKVQMMMRLGALVMATGSSPSSSPTAVQPKLPSPLSIPPASKRRGSRHQDTIIGSYSCSYNDLTGEENDGEPSPDMPQRSITSPR